MKTNYKPYDSKKLPRYEGIRTFMRLPNFEEVEEGVDFAVVGVPIDGASTYESGQRMGPNAIRNSSVNCRSYHPEFDINIFEYLSGIDFGDVPMLPGYIEECYANTEKMVKKIYDAGAMPIALGGDHSVTLPLLRAAAEKHGKISLLHFDSHYDNNADYFGKAYNHATWVYHGVKEGLIDPATSIQLGLRGTGFRSDRDGSIDLGIQAVTTSEIKYLGIEKVGGIVRDRIGANKVYCSFDIDFVDPAFAPGTGTIEPGGFSSFETFELIKEVKDINFIGMDLVELLPTLDHGGITSNLAANIIFYFLGIKAMQKRAQLKQI